MGVIIDSGFFIRAERTRNADWRFKLPRVEESAISAISVTELLTGFHLAAATAAAARRQSFIEDILSLVPVAAFNVETARVHARLRASLRKQGKMIGAHDLIIAATAVSLGWDVLTFNANEFRQVDGLGVREA